MINLAVVARNAKESNVANGSLTMSDTSDLLHLLKNTDILSSTAGDHEYAVESTEVVLNDNGTINALMVHTRKIGRETDE